MSASLNRRALLRHGAGLGLALPALWPSLLKAQAADDALLPRIHPDLRQAAAYMRNFQKDASPLSRATLADKRIEQRRFDPQPLADVPHEVRTIRGRRGQPDVTAYLINAASPAARAGRLRPAIVHTHGGGFVMGSARSAVPGLQALCKTLDCMALTVEYRLAPETTYAGSIEDNYAALKWLHDNAAELGVDPARIAVMGESAGGGHAALLAITARDRGEVPLAFQCLVYPMLDDRTGTTRGVPPFVGAIIWTPAANRFGWESFLGAKPGGLSAPKGAVPARLLDFKGLPPAFVGVGTLDLFCDENIEYAQRLNSAGVPAELIVVPGAFHGFDEPRLPSPVGSWFTAAKLNALRRGLGIAAV